MYCKWPGVYSVASHFFLLSPTCRSPEAGRGEDEAGWGRNSKTRGCWTVHVNSYIKTTAQLFPLALKCCFQIWVVSSEFSTKASLNYLSRSVFTPVKFKRDINTFLHFSGLCALHLGISCLISCFLIDRTCGFSGTDNNNVNNNNTLFI